MGLPVSLLLTVPTVGATGLTADFPVLLALRFASGFTGALAFVLGVDLRRRNGRFQKPNADLVGCLYLRGRDRHNSIRSGAPVLLATVIWRGGWLVLGALALAATVCVWLVLGRTPEPSYTPAGTACGGWLLRSMTYKVLAYCLFGVGYIAYATSIIAYLRSNGGFSRPMATRDVAERVMAAKGSAVADNHRRGPPV